MQSDSHKHSIVFSFQESTDNPVRVIVKGELASGKSTLIKNICKEWSMVHKRNEEPVCSEVRDIYGQYDLLIPVNLRLVKHGATLEDTIRDQMDLDDRQILILCYMLKNMERTILILDGLDEYKTNTSRDITNIIKGNIFEHVVITTNKTQEWKKSIYKEVELRGFSDEQIKFYVDKFFKTFTELGISLISHIFNKDSYLLELARNPGSLSLLCILQKDKVPIHTMNREELYQEYVAFLLSRWEQRQKEVEKTSRSAILKKYHTTLLKFGELAANINEKSCEVDCEYKHKSDEVNIHLSFTIEQIHSMKVKDALNLGFIYESHHSSRLVSSRFEFIHQTIYEFLLAYFIAHSNRDSFKQSLYKNRELLERELSLTRFLLHLYMTPTEAYEFTRNIIRSIPDKDLFIVLLKLYKEYQRDAYQTTLTFSDDRYCYIFQYPCYVIHADRRHQDSLSSFNKGMTRKMNTGTKHRAVTVPVLNTASRQAITSGDGTHDCDLSIYCRPDYEVTVTGDALNLKMLYIHDIQKVGNINLHAVNDNLYVVVYNTNLHGCVGLTKPWVTLIQSLTMYNCKLDNCDISVLADSIQARNRPTACPCRLEKLDLSCNSLTGAGANIARIIICLPVCTEISLGDCDLNDEDFHAIVNAVIKTHSDGQHDDSTPDSGQASSIKPASHETASHIEYLYLNDNKITYIETVRLLLDNLPPSLQELWLEGNQFNDEEASQMKILSRDRHPNLNLNI